MSRIWDRFWARGDQNQLTVSEYNLSEKIFSTRFQHRKKMTGRFSQTTHLNHNHILLKT